MRITIITLATLLATACSNSGSSQLDPSVIKDNISAENIQSNPDGMPKVTYNKIEHDFGMINEGEVVEYKFILTNSGEADLIISDATGDCGCTVPKYPKEPIKPGKSADIIVSFNSAGRVGENTKRVTVTTNAAEAQSFLTIRSTVLPKN